MNKNIKTISDSLGGVTKLLIQQGGFAFGEGYTGFDTGFKNKVSFNDLTGTLLNPINSIISNLSFLLRWEEWNLVREKVKIWDFLDKIIIDYSDLANSKNIWIKLEILKDFEIISNKYYLERLFSNLIMNSIYYNNWNNELKIIVNKSLLEIIDNWIWIKQEDLEKIHKVLSCYF